VEVVARAARGQQQRVVVGRQLVRRQVLGRFQDRLAGWLERAVLGVLELGAGEQIAAVGLASSGAAKKRPSA
jgi:hypothetical protein